MSRPRKHVIILGAGASFGSGYPLANTLRLLLSSSDHFSAALAKALAKVGMASMDHGKQTALELFDSTCETIDLFRNGGFASVDEFCKLASAFPRYAERVNAMRLLTRGVLGIGNPEDTFEVSEYYPFVQALFQDNLFELRDDISVLSFNYDPYLEYLLLRALEQRRRVAGRQGDAYLTSTATSGFYHLDNPKWLTADEGMGDRFCLLKLHGVIAAPQTEGHVNHKVLFESPPRERIERLFHHPNRADSVVPIIFPWELIQDNLEFIPAKEFPLAALSPVYFKLFKAIWERARREIQRADKISFVGISMHPFLNFGLNYLFQGKSGKVHFVVVNPDNETREKHGKPSLDRITPAGRVRTFLQSISHDWEDPDGIDVHRYEFAPGGSITSLKSFEQFIREEMR